MGVISIPHVIPRVQRGSLSAQADLPLARLPRYPIPHVILSEPRTEMVRCEAKNLDYVAWQLVRLGETSLQAGYHVQRWSKLQRYTLWLFHFLRMMLNRGFVTASFLGFLSLCIILLVLFHSSPLFAGDTDNTEKQTEKELIEQYEKQQGLYEKLQKEFDNHPVTKWKREVDRNKKAIAILDKQLRDMVRFENEEQIEELRRNNEELQKKIEAKKDEWEGLKKKLDDAKKQLESLKKQPGPAVVEEILGEKTR